MKFDIFILLMYLNKICWIDTIQLIENDSISYCKWDSFIPKCLGNDIIIIQSALYGRMSVGKCLTSYYQIGCYANVQDYLDFVCTGKTNCSLTIPNKYLDFMHSCRRDLSSYLTVTYQCHKVVTEKQCNVKPKENIVLTKNGYISTFSIFKSKSEKSCILYLTAEKGKRWNITIFNLNNVNVNSTKTLQFIITLMKNNSKGPYIHSINNGHCSSVAEIHENSLKYSLSMCPVNQNLAVNGYINQHYKTISFFSQTSNIVIHFVSPFSNIRQKSINNFLFQYQEIGCKNIHIKDSEHLVNRYNKIIFQCTNSFDIFTLLCINSEWIGPRNNCIGTSNYANGQSKLFMNNAVTMATIGIFSILIIGLLILTIAFIVYTRYTKKTFFQPKKKEKAIKKNSLDYIYNCQILLNKAAPFNSKGSKKKTSHENKTMNIKQNLLCGIAKPIFNSENCHNLSNKISLVKPCCIYQR